MYNFKKVNISEQDMELISSGHIPHVNNQNWHMPWISICENLGSDYENCLDLFGRNYATFSFLIKSQKSSWFTSEI